MAEAQLLPLISVNYADPHLVEFYLLDESASDQFRFGRSLRGSN